MIEVPLGSAVYVGPLGSGNITKLANQIIVACNIAAVGEALTFATKSGADPELVYKAIRGGLAGSTVLDAKAPMMLDRNFKPGFRIELHIKDLNNALNASNTYVTYHIHVVGENDTIDSITNNYKISKDILSEYNDLSNLNIGDKILIPELQDE